MSRKLKISLGVILFFSPAIAVGTYRGLDLLSSKYAMPTAAVFLFGLAMISGGMWLMWEGYKDLKGRSK